MKMMMTMIMLMTMMMMLELTPFKEASLTGSLQQLGKSRADLWQFAGLVALERALERANRACDLDKWSRQQVSLLEGREACEFKLRAPLKFWSGRADCVSEDGGSGYKASKTEVQPRLLGDGKHATDFFLEEFGMSPEHSQALQAVHGAVHSSSIGTKYTWFGPGYISSMYYRLISNQATYELGKYGGGGDLSFKGLNEPGVNNVNLHAKGGNILLIFIIFMFSVRETLRDVLGIKLAGERAVCTPGIL